MPKYRTVVTEGEVSDYPEPALTDDGRESQIIAAAIDLAEKKIRDGTASNQLIIHYLKLGSSQQRLENEKLKAEVELAKTKVKAIEASEKTDRMFAEAIAAMKRYQGNTREPDDVEEL